MKKVVKYIGRGLLTIFLSFLLFIYLIYSSPVQQYFKDKVIDYLKEKYDFALQIGNLRLKFPFELSLENVCGMAMPSDTLFALESFQLNVGLKRIFQQQLTIEKLELWNGKLKWKNDSTGMLIYADLGLVSCQANLLDLKQQQIDIEEIRCWDGNLKYFPGDSSAETHDTTTTLAWLIQIGVVDLQRLNCQMSMEGMPELKTILKNGQIDDTQIDLGKQLVTLDSLYLAGGNIDLALSESEKKKKEQVQQDTLLSLPWTIEAGTIRLENSAFTMRNEESKTVELVLSGIGIQLDSLYNRGSIVKLQLKDLQAVQQDGIVLSTMHADIGLDSTAIWARGGFLRTLHSWLNLEVYANSDVSKLMEHEPLLIQLQGEVGMMDLLPFYAEIPSEIQEKILQVNTTLSLTNERLQVGQLILDLPEHFKLTGSGSFSDFQYPEKITGSAVVRCEMPNVSFVQSFLGDMGIAVPNEMNLLARVYANRGNMTGFFKLCQDSGYMSVDANYGVVTQRYGAEVDINQFPLKHFLPTLPLGNVSTKILLEGAGFEFEKSKAELNAEFRHVDFLNHDYRDIVLRVDLDTMCLKADLISKDSSIPLHLSFKVDSIKQGYVWELQGDLGRIDLHKLHLMENPLAFKADIDLQGSMEQENDYRLVLNLENLQMWDDNKQYHLGNLQLIGESHSEKTELHLSSGDLDVKFQTDTFCLAFTERCESVADLLLNQWEVLNIDMKQIQEELPPFALRVRGAQNNAVVRFLKSKGIEMKELEVAAISRNRSGIRMGMRINSPCWNEVQLDSVRLGVWQTGKSLMYSMTAGSSSEEWKGLFNIHLTGRVQGDRFRVELKQQDAQGKVGFDCGLNAVLGDSVTVISVFPTDPVLGYSRWDVNQNNQLIVGSHGKLWSNLNMTNQEKLIRFQSLENTADQQDRLRIKMSGIDLVSLSQMIPFMPQLSGMVNTDLLLYSRKQEIGGKGSIQLQNFGYEQQRIGTIGLGVDYLASNSFSDHAIQTELTIDSLPRAMVSGTFSTAEKKSEVDLNLHLLSFPLTLANAFLPAEVVRLNGNVVGNLSAQGTFNQPRLNGCLSFQGGEINAIMLGSTFRLDTHRVSISEGRISLNEFGIRASNQNVLKLNGSIALTPLDRMQMDLSLNARNFELMNVKKNKNSLIYGKAYANIQTRIQGALSDLNASGNVRLLNQSDITYVLRSSDLVVEDKETDFVQFVSSQDTTLNEERELSAQVEVHNFVLQMLINIGEQVRFGVELSESGNDRVLIQGGGNLLFSMKPESGMTLSGKYILTDGSVVYNVPVVGKKEFAIRHGSFVEWASDVMNPILNIAASSQVKAEVVEGEQTHQVVFESIIRIQNTLNRPEITFDLSSPNDMVIQNQLATFSAEERTRQALNLLIYNTYTAPGSANTNSSSQFANNAIYSFVENELNKYTRKAGLTVGFDSHQTLENTTRTDVTYQFSKQLFNDRMRVKIGGRVSTDGKEGQGGGSLQDNLVDDISIEYMLTKRQNLYMKIFRQANYESVLDGEVIQTGAGLVWRKNFRTLKDLFINKKRAERKAKRRIKQTEKSDEQ